MKTALRTAAVHVLYGLGLLQLWARLALRRRAVVLMYHRVLPDEERSRTWSHPAIVVSRRTFERHMRMLSRRFRVLSAVEFQRCLEEGQFYPFSCLVTFDDGWIDTYTEAWPVLRRYGLPALVFLPSAFIGTGEVFWQERLGSLLRVVWQRARNDQAFAARAEPVLAGLDLNAVLDLKGDDTRLAIMDLVRSKKGHDAWDPQGAVRAVSALVPGAFAAGDSIDRFIDWEQALEMARGGVSFGAHGDSHRLLTTLAPEDVGHEVRASRASLERRLGASPVAFCYPNGDWNAGVAEVVGRQFALAFSTRRGHVDPKRENRLAIRRINVHEDMTRTEPLMLARLLGII
jgi:peptidoglycan/xylan/chitin deacetylase (PgdA/CDA1 family)